MKNPIARYLMCAYAYYVEDDPLIPDTEFDELSKYILKNYEAGTYLGHYPSMIKGAVKSYRDE